MERRHSPHRGRSRNLRGTSRRRAAHLQARVLPPPHSTLLPVLNPAPAAPPEPTAPTDIAPSLPPPIHALAAPVPAAPLSLILQLADSAFPTGGFAHSGGLEAAWQLGEIHGRTQLAGFLEASLRQTTTASLPLVAVSHREPDRLPELDQLTDAWTSNHVANRASRLQGRAFWTAISHAFLPDSPPPPQPGHFAPLFGSLLRELAIPLDITAHLFLFQHLRGLVSAAVRLGIVGPLEAQGIQGQLSPLTTSLAARAPSLTLDDLAQSAPLLDLWQGAQDRLYSRLFQS